MFADYLRELHPALRVEGASRYMLSASMLGGVTLLNVKGVDTVANVSSLFTMLVVSPFAALVLCALPTLEPSAWFAGPAPRVVSNIASPNPLSINNGHDDEDSSGGARWGTFLAVLLWNTSGYDSVGAVAAEVADPGRDLPRAMIAAIVLISLVYVLPVGAGVSLDGAANAPRWTDGSLARVAGESVGAWLALWISLGGALSAFGLLNTLLCAASRIVVSAAEIGVLPNRLARLHPRSGTPVWATLTLSAGLLLVLSLSFAELVEFSMLFCMHCTSGKAAHAAHRHDLRKSSTMRERKVHFGRSLCWA